jgi:hypothetical protein
MIGLTGLGQAAIAAFGPNGTVPAQPASSVFIFTSTGDHAAAYEQASRGYVFFFAGVTPGNTASPPQVKSDLILRQEQPWHPGSRFWWGVQGPNVEAPVTYELILRQEQPWHPGSFLWAGRQQAGNVAPPDAGQVVLLTTQQQPWHPPSFLFSAPPPVPKAIPFKQPAIIVQERPWHPGSLFSALRSGLDASTSASMVSCNSEMRMSQRFTASMSLALSSTRLPSGLTATSATARRRANALSAIGCVTKTRGRGIAGPKSP